jgi:protein-S-isoprenylcysteine O-methyltransferase Ste14
MGIDIRLPLGTLFTLLGVILAVFGAFSDRAIYARSLGYNVNLWWGLVLTAFGLVLLYLARRRTAQGHPGRTDDP